MRQGRRGTFALTSPWRIVALLRAVNVGGRKLPMAELRALCGELGWTEVETYIQSGNLVCSTRHGKAEALEALLEAAIGERFGLRGPGDRPNRGAMGGLCRRQSVSRRPREDEPNRLQLLVSKRSPTEAPPPG